MAYQSEYTGTEIDRGISLALAMYPVGSIYLSVNNVNPGTIFGDTWEQIQDRFLLAAGSTYGGGSTGGSDTHTHTTAGHTLTVAETPAHTHTRGTMNITGELNYNQTYSGNIFSSDGLVGAFTSNNTSAQDYYVNGRSPGSGWPENIIFDASRTWTGETSSIGEGSPHNHGNTGSSSSLPPYIAIYVWKRTA